MAARDVLWIIVVLFVSGIGFFAVNFAVNNAVDHITNNTVINQSNSSKTAFLSIKSELTNRMDYVIFGLFIGLILALIISGWFVAGNPVFMFIYIIILVIGTVLSAILSNVYETYSNMPIFGTTLLQFPITSHLLSYLPMYALIIGFIGIVVMFAKPALRQVEY